MGPSRIALPTQRAVLSNANPVDLPTVLAYVTNLQVEHNKLVIGFNSLISEIRNSGLGG